MRNQKKKKILIIAIVSIVLTCAVLGTVIFNSGKNQIKSKNAEVENAEVGGHISRDNIDIYVQDDSRSGGISVLMNRDNQITNIEGGYIESRYALEHCIIEKINEETGEIIDAYGIKVLEQNDWIFRAKIIENGQYIIRVEYCNIIKTYNEGVITNIERRIYGFNVNFTIEYIIDENPPTETTISASTTEWTNQNVTLTGSAKENSINDTGIGKYQFSTDENLNKTSDGWQTVERVEKETEQTYLATESGTYYFYAMDCVENISRSNPITVKIDKENPIIESITGNPSNWTTENITLTVNAKDTISGLPQKPYSFDGGVTWQENNTKTYTDNASNIIIKVRDNAGNIVTADPINITKIRRLENISIKTLPSKTEYIVGETLKIDGLTLNANYSNRDTETITQGFTYTPNKLETVGNQKITVTYQNKSTTFNVKVAEITVTSNIYNVEKTQITSIQPNTTLSKFKGNITTNANTIKAFRGTTELKNTDILGTGISLQFENRITYKIIVKGDCNGDGKSDLQDILSINKHRLNKTQLTNEYLKAGDINNDGKVDTKDIMQINKYRLEKINKL